MVNSRQIALRRRAAIRKKRRITNRALNSKINRISRRLNQSEVKYYNTNVIISNNSTSIATINVRSNMGQGVTAQTRIGEKIEVRDIQMNGYISFSDNTLNRQSILFMVVLDKQQAGTPPVTDSGISSANGILQDADMNSTLNMEANKGRFKILYKRVFNFTRPGSYNLRKSFHFGKKFKTPLVIEYLGPGATDADMGKNNIYTFMLVSDTTTTTATTIDLYTSIRYRDL